MPGPIANRPSARGMAGRSRLPYKENAASCALLGSGIRRGGVPPRSLALGLAGRRCMNVIDRSERLCRLGAPRELSGLEPGPRSFDRACAHSATVEIMPRETSA